jgi:di/tricarboxylate transporter
VLLGGMATLLTTSNIIVSGALREAGYAHYGLLDFLPIGAPIVVAGTLYMVLVGRRLLPREYPSRQAARGQALQAALFSLYGIEKHLNNIAVLPGAAMAGQSIADGQWYPRLGLSVVGLIRGGHLRMAPKKEECIDEGDILLVQGEPQTEQLARYGLKLLENPALPIRVADETVVLAEVVLTPRTSLVGKGLREIHFREKYGFNVLALWREGNPLVQGIPDIPLRFGDALLVQGPAMRLQILRSEPDFIVLEEDPDPVIRPSRARLALTITLVVLGIAAFDWLPMAVVAMAGAVLLLITDCVNMEDIYRSVEWKAIFLIAGMWPLSTAIRSSGLADHAVGAILAQIGVPSPLVVAAILLITSMGVTQIIGGQVASLILAPLALSAAHTIQSDPRGLGMAVALGCSLGFMTPFGHPVNIMVMSSGGYTFRDFIKVGTPLTILVIAIILIGLRLFWGF